VRDRDDLPIDAQGILVVVGMKPLVEFLEQRFRLSRFFVGESSLLILAFPLAFRQARFVLLSGFGEFIAQVVLHGLLTERNQISAPQREDRRDRESPREMFFCFPRRADSIVGDFFRLRMCLHI
jgi:hypothetical protein